MPTKREHSLHPTMKDGAFLLPYYPPWAGAKIRMLVSKMPDGGGDLVGWILIPSKDGADEIIDVGTIHLQDRKEVFLCSGTVKLSGQPPSTNPEGIVRIKDQRDAPSPRFLWSGYRPNSDQSRWTNSFTVMVAEEDLARWQSGELNLGMANYPYLPTERKPIGFGQEDLEFILETGHKIKVGILPTKTLDFKDGELLIQAISESRRFNTRDLWGKYVMLGPLPTHISEVQVRVANSNWIVGRISPGDLTAYLNQPLLIPITEPVRRVKVHVISESGADLEDIKMAVSARSPGGQHSVSIKGDGSAEFLVVDSVQGPLRFRVHLEGKGVGGTRLTELADVPLADLVDGVEIVLRSETSKQ